MTNIIACSELRYRTGGARDSVQDTSDRARAHRARFARARYRACQPRQRPPRHGGAPRPASEAVSAALWSVLEAVSIPPAASGLGFNVARRPVRSEARYFRAVRRARNGRDWRPLALRSRLAAGGDTGIRLHPNMATYYRAHIGDLRTALTESGSRMEAAEIVRKLIDRIELCPVVRKGRSTLSVSLYGRLAGILAMATKAKAPLDESDAPMKVTKLVAGAGSGLCDICNAQGLEPMT
jgi:hypothetical protein